MTFEAGILGALTATLALVAGAACSSVNVGTDAGVAEDVAPDLHPDLRPDVEATDLPASDVPPLACHLGETSDLPGVSIHILRDDCTFTTAQARAGISIPYDVTVEHDVDITVAPTPGSFCYGPGPTGLLILELLSGGGQRYCLCDRGLPYGQLCQMTTTLHQGVYHASFDWDGVNWSGPSDTGNPKGAPFPAGSYRLDITAKGYRGPVDAGSAPFTINAAFGVNLTN